MEEKTKNSNSIFSEEVVKMANELRWFEKNIEQVVSEYEESFSKSRELSERLVYIIVNESKTYGDLEKAMRVVWDKISCSGMEKGTSRAAQELFKHAFYSKVDNLPVVDKGVAVPKQKVQEQQNDEINTEEVIKLIMKQLRTEVR